MKILELGEAEDAIIEAVKLLCSQLAIDEEVDADSCPGKYLRSDALVSVVPSIEQKLKIKIPLECYIFHDNNKNKEKLSIKAAAKKLLKIAKYEQQEQ